MKARIDPKYKLCQAPHPFASNPDQHNNRYIIKGPQERLLNLIVSNYDGWDHVSVSVVDSEETPTWAEMCWVKDEFFDPHEVVLQYHPAKRNYVNIHPGCLHLWRPQKDKIHTPPLYMV